MEFQNTLGTAIIYRDMCNAARLIIEQAGAGETAAGRLRALLRGAAGSAAGRALAAALRQAPCPAAAERGRSPKRPLACPSPPRSRSPGFFDAFAAHAVGLCLPHLRNVAARIATPRSSPGWPRRASHEFAATEADLSEVIRKYDYRFNREPHGPNGTVRGIEQMGGRLPTLLDERARPHLRSLTPSGSRAYPRPSGSASPDPAPGSGRSMWRRGSGPGCRRKSVARGLTAAGTCGKLGRK